MRLFFIILLASFPLVQIGCSLFLPHGSGDPVSDGLVGHWTFDDCVEQGRGGCAAEDQTRTAPDAVIYGASLTEGRLGRAFSFDGEDDYGMIPHGEVFNGERKSIQFWFRKSNAEIDDSPSRVDAEGLVFKAPDTGFDRAFTLTLQNALAPFDLVLSAGNGSATLERITLPKAILVDEWYHVVFTIDSTELMIYLDGVLVGTLDLTAQTINNASPIYLASIPGSSADARYFSGLLDDLRFYNRVLKAEEVRTLYELPTTE